MEFIATRLPNLALFKPRVFADDRGFFMETYRQRTLAAWGIASSFVQDNHSGSRQGVLRGLHYQVGQPQGKLVRVTVGEVFDVAVDLRPNSGTFGQWEGFRLSSDNKLMAWIPPGFAHGFYVLSDWAEFSYKVTDYYSPSSERTLLWNDPDLAIDWPLLENQSLVVSAKDAQGLRLRDLCREELLQGLNMADAA